MLDGAIMRTNPTAHGSAGVPTGIIPKQNQNRLAEGVNLLASPGQELNRDGTQRPTLDEAQQHFFGGKLLRDDPAQQEAVTGQSFGFRITFRFALFDQPQGLLLIRPTRQAGLRKAAPPRLILKAPDPATALGQGD